MAKQYTDSLIEELLIETETKDQPYNRDIEYISLLLGDKPNAPFISYDSILDFFESYQKLQPSDYNNEVVMTMIEKLKRIADASNYTEFAQAKTWTEKLQYSCNAYLIEQAVRETFDADGGTGDTDDGFADHFYFHTNDWHRFISKPDLKDVDVNSIGGAAVKGKCTIEVKCYLDSASALSYLNSSDRTHFYDADFIIAYIIKDHAYYIRPNKILDEGAGIGWDIYCKKPNKLWSIKEDNGVLNITAYQQ